MRRAYSPLLVYSGEASGFSASGAKCRVRLTPGGHVFERNLPRFLVQAGCNFCLFSDGCGLSRDAWQFQAVVASYAVGYPFALMLTGLAKTGGGSIPSAAQWFGGGEIEIGTGASARRLPVLQSSGVFGGALTVTLPRDPYPLPAVSETVKLWPGCDGGFVTCSVKFGNRGNFGGHPFMPVGNPSLVKLSSAVAGGKK